MWRNNDQKTLAEDLHDHRDHEEHKWATTHDLCDRTHQGKDSNDRMNWRLGLEESHTWEQGNLWSPKVRNKNPAIAGGQNKEHATTWTLHQTLDRMKQGASYHLGSMDPQRDHTIVQKRERSTCACVECEG